MHSDNIIDKNTKRFLTQPSPRPGRSFSLPKIDKQSNPGRPIVSTNGHPTERLSRFVDYHFQPLVKLPIHSSKIPLTHFSTKLKQLGHLPDDALLATLDVSSLYSNFLARFEANALTLSLHKPHIWWRYTDNIFMAWTHSVTAS